MCNSCFSEKIKAKTTFTVDYDNCIIVVKNVPCLECEFCGETFFSDEVSSKLEKLVQTAKQMYQEISVIDYLKAS